MQLIQKLLFKIKKIDFDFKELIKGGIISLFFKIFSVVSSFLLISILSKKWGASAVGFFSTYWTIVLIISVFSKLGFDTYLVKLIPEKIGKNQKSSIITIYKKTITIISLTVVFISIPIYFFQDELKKILFHENQFPFFIFALSLLLYCILSINAETLKSLKKITSFSLLQNGSIYFIIALFFIFFNFSDKYAIPISLAFLISFGVLFLFSEISVFNVLKNFNTPSIKRKDDTISYTFLIKKSYPMMLSNSLFLLMSWVDIIMLSLLSNSADVGIYNTSLKIASSITIGLMGVNTIAMPKFSELKDKSSRFKFTAQKSIIFSLVFALPLLLLINIFPEYILNLFGQEFKTGVTSLRILSIGFFFSVLAGSVISILNMTGEAHKVKNILIISVVLNLFLNRVLIPLWGINGAAIATSTTTIFWNFISLIYIYRKFKFIPLLVRNKKN